MAFYLFASKNHCFSLHPKFLKRTVFFFLELSMVNDLWFPVGQKFFCLGSSNTFKQETIQVCASDYYLYAELCYHDGMS